MGEKKNPSSRSSFFFLPPSLAWREIPSSPWPPAAAPWINKHASLRITQPVHIGLIKNVPMQLQWP